MTFLTSFVDGYDLRARLIPALLVIVPVPVTVVCLASTPSKVATSVLSILVASGASFALSRVARNAGKRVEPSLFRRWGGAPTTQLLRHANSTIDPITKARYHTVLSKGIGQAMPSVAEERGDQHAADRIYSAAVIWLIGRTRDAKRFPLVFKENVSYGFHRNAFGMRPLGIVVSIAAVLATLLVAGVLRFTQPLILPPDAQAVTVERLISLAVALTMVAAWGVVFREGSVKSAAFAYGIRLLEACDNLASSHPVTSKPGKGTRKAR